MSGYRLRGMQAVEKHIPANKVGKLAGYCAHCGGMLMDKERVCPSCEGVGMVSQAPEPSSLWRREYE